MLLTVLFYWLFITLPPTLSPTSLGKQSAIPSSKENKEPYVT
jgi:hypothetical protein